MADSRERIRAPPRDGREGFTSPRQVLRRLMLLSEGRQYREAATVVGRLGPSVLRSVVAELPMDILIEALPHSTYLLESFFNRLNAVVATPRPDVPCEAIMWHLVKLFSNPHETGLRQRCMKLAQAIGIWQPSLRESLLARRKQLDQAIQGLGVHGLTADQTGSLISLHVALKNELQRHIDTYKAAIHKLEELSPVTAHQDPAQSSHQRLLAIGYGDIQQRLIDNKTLLTMLDKPALKQLAQLVENLSQRVQNDKEVLFCVGQIRRTDATANTEERPAAGLLMNYSRGCDTVLGLMGPIATLPPSSPTSNGCSSGGSDGYHSDSDIDETNSELVRQYSVMYSKNRIDTLDSLNALPQLKHAHQLKAKILFSIIVVTCLPCLPRPERAQGARGTPHTVRAGRKRRFDGHARSGSAAAAEGDGRPVPDGRRRATGRQPGAVHAARVPLPGGLHTAHPLHQRLRAISVAHGEPNQPVLSGYGLYSRSSATGEARTIPDIREAVRHYPCVLVASTDAEWTLRVQGGRRYLTCAHTL